MRLGSDETAGRPSSARASTNTIGSHSGGSLNPIGCRKGGALSRCASRRDAARLCGREVGRGLVNIM
jgi:hypothetical protein